MIDENEDFKSSPQSIKAAVICEQTIPLNIHDRTLNNHSGSAQVTKSWEPILEKAIKAIVSIKANRVRNFDTAKSG